MTVALTMASPALLADADAYAASVGATQSEPDPEVASDPEPSPSPSVDVPAAGELSESASTNTETENATKPEPASVEKGKIATESPEKPDEEASVADPCKQPPSYKEAWLDRVRRGVFYSVCGSAAWFDNFFGDKHTYDPRQVYGRLSGGLLYDVHGDWKERTKFDANIPLPNFARRTTAFLGRDNAEQFIADSNQSLSAPIAFRETSDDRSWLAGFGYNPPGKRGSFLNYRLGAKVSSHPYVFGQARFRYNHYTSKNTAVRFHETLFYRTNDDRFGATTYLGYDWIPRRANLARISGEGTVSEDTDGVKWKSYATFYQDLEFKSGKPRGVAYQLLSNGETQDDVQVHEYGFLTIYREQMFRPWFYGEVSVGYSWTRADLADDRRGGATVGFVFDILFGDYYDNQ